MHTIESTIIILSVSPALFHISEGNTLYDWIYLKQYELQNKIDIKI